MIYIKQIAINAIDTIIEHWEAIKTAVGIWTIAGIMIAFIWILI